MIKSLYQMEEMVLALKKKHRVAVAWAHDPNTIGAIYLAVKKNSLTRFLLENHQKS